MVRQRTGSIKRIITEVDIYSPIEQQLTQPLPTKTGVFSQRFRTH
jgi:hypothetical protein